MTPAITASRRREIPVRRLSANISRRNGRGCSARTVARIFETGVFVTSLASARRVASLSAQADAIAVIAAACVLIRASLSLLSIKIDRRLLPLGYRAYFRRRTLYPHLGP